MTVAADIPPEVQTYLSAVREALADLPADERDDLLSEVEASLTEAANESGDRPLTARLGPPQDFAEELRAAAGLHAGTSRRPWTGLTRGLESFRADARVRAAWGLVMELAPIWWLARAYIAVGVYAIATDSRWLPTYPIPRIGGTAETGAIVIAAAALLSVWLGLATRRASLSARRVATAANVLLILASPLVLDRVQNRPLAATPPVFVSTPSAGLTFNGAAVQNIYPYSRDGRLLHDVLLFDSYGQPLVITGEDALRRYLKTRSGRTVFNSFPIRHYEPGTKTVANPDAGPDVWLPKVATPPLAER